MTERDKAICKLYVSGKTLKECGLAHGITHERVRQILRKAGIYRNLRPVPLGLKDGVVESDVRDEFLGVNLSETDKAGLREEAERRGLSMSSLTNDLIREMLATVRSA